MADIIVQHVALVSESDSVSLAEAAQVSAALQKQVVRDFGSIWLLQATVDAFETLEDVPLGYWPMIVMDNIGFDAAGIHLDRDGQPFALITSGGGWALTASHECLEMLADPFGDRLVAGDSPKPDQGRVEFLIEVCDPSEAAEFGYTVNGILLSDFYTPRFFDPVVANGVRYSFTGAIREPRDVLRGGYLSWHDPVSNDWWQETWFSGNQSQFVNLGPLDLEIGSFRSQIDRLTNQPSSAAMNERRAERTGVLAAAIAPAKTSKAAMWRQQIEELSGQEPAEERAEVRRTGGVRARRSDRRRTPSESAESAARMHRRHPPGHRD